MDVRTYSSSQARAQWRDVLDLVVARADVVITRHGKPVAAMIAYDEYGYIREEYACSAKSPKGGSDEKEG